jgi:NADH-quinone oxidoreductase subunit M
MGLLSIAIWLPIAFGVLLLAVGRDEHVRVVRAIALAGAVASFLVTVPLITGFDVTTAKMQFVEKLAWIDRFNIHYHLGLDGLSLWFVPLTAFITVVVVIAAWEVITVPGRVSHSQRPGGGCVCLARRHAVLRVL